MIFVTGATGRVGSAIIEALGPRIDVRGACRERVDRPGTTHRTTFDFQEPEGFAAALDGVSAVFLMRPPQIAKAAVFHPFLEALKARRIRRIVMLSVAGADRNPLLPHHGMETLLQRPEFDWTILRPSDFMQNLETVHADAIREHDEIAVPASNGRSAFVDVADLGGVGSRVLTEPGHIGKAYRLTGPEALSFTDVAEILTAVLGRSISYRSPGLWRFIRDQRRAGAPLSLALVMSALYTIQRLGGAAEVTGDLARLLGREPTRFRTYAVRQRRAWLEADDAAREGMIGGLNTMKRSQP